MPGIRVTLPVSLRLGFSGKVRSRVTGSAQAAESLAGSESLTQSAAASMVPGTVSRVPAPGRPGGASESRSGPSPCLAAPAAAGPRSSDDRDWRGTVTRPVTGTVTVAAPADATSAAPLLQQLLLARSLGARASPRVKRPRRLRGRRRRRALRLLGRRRGPGLTAGTGNRTGNRLGVPGRRAGRQDGSRNRSGRRTGRARGRAVHHSGG
jgi:hypothetical protein